MGSIFVGLNFPFRAQLLKTSGYQKYLHIALVVAGLTLPIIPICIAFGVEGYGINPLSPVTCTSLNRYVTFYSVVLPVFLVVMIGIVLLIITFWRLRKVSFSC